MARRTGILPGYQQKYHHMMIENTSVCVWVGVRKRRIPCRAKSYSSFLLLFVEIKRSTHDPQPTHLEDSFAGAVAVIPKSPRQLLPQVRLRAATARVPTPEVGHSTACYSRHHPHGPHIVELSDLLTRPQHLVNAHLLFRLPWFWTKDSIRRNRAAGRPDELRLKNCVMRIH